MSEQKQEANKPVPAVPSSSQTDTKQQSGDGGGGAVKIIIGIIVALIAVLVLGFVVAVILALANPAAAEGVQIVRDFFIIAMALEGMLIGIALIILVLQVARLTNLLQNEIKPIIEQTGDTVKTVKGTATFMSKNVADPVIRASGFLAWFRAILSELFGIFRAVR